MPTDEELLIEKGQDESLGFGTLGKFGTGVGLLGASAAMMRGQTPGGIRRTTADYSSNKLLGFYSQPTLGDFYSPQVRKAKAYGKELIKTGSRISRDAVFNLANSEFYNKTGISPVVMRDIDNIDKITDETLKKYIGPKGRGTKYFYKQNAKNIIRNSEKDLYFKLTNDKSNAILNNSKVSKEVENIIGNAVKQTNANHFIKNAQSREVAQFAITRWGALNKQNLNLVTPKDMKFIRYKTEHIGNTLRNAQFDRGMYKTMLDLKNSGAITSSYGFNNAKIYNAETILANAVKKGFIGGDVMQRGNTFIFSLSPKGKSNYDFGGFNAVAQWDAKNPQFIKLMATDVGDVDAFGKSIKATKTSGIKYVPLKEIEIKEAKLRKELTDEIPKKKPKTSNESGNSRTERKPEDILKRQSVFNQEQRQKIADLKSKRKSFNVSFAKKIPKLGRALPGVFSTLMFASVANDIAGYALGQKPSEWLYKQAKKLF